MHDYPKPTLSNYFRHAALGALSSGQFGLQVGNLLVLRSDGGTGDAKPAITIG